MASRILKTGENQITTKFSTGHKAVDIVKYKSQLDYIIAHSAGKVVFCQTGHKNNKGSKGNASYGNCVKIDHGHGYSTIYAHLNTVSVKLGEWVEQGQVIGRMGNTGNSYGAHLHWEVRLNNKHIDPTPYLNSDLPIDETPHAKYCAYTTKWWGEITDYNEINTNGYAGVQGKNMTALTAYSTSGTLMYRAHLLGKPKDQWLAWISDSDKNNAKRGYAGVKGRKIDAIQMKLEGLDGYEVKYRVSPSANSRWHGWCVGQKDETGDGYAGVFGQAIDCIQIAIVKV